MTRASKTQDVLGISQNKHYESVRISMTVNERTRQNVTTTKTVKSEHRSATASATDEDDLNKCIMAREQFIIQHNFEMAGLDDEYSALLATMMNLDEKLILMMKQHEIILRDSESMEMQLIARQNIESAFTARENEVDQIFRDNESLFDMECESVRASIKQYEARCSEAQEAIAASTEEIGDLATRIHETRLANYQEQAKRAALTKTREETARLNEIVGNAVSTKKQLHSSYVLIDSDISEQQSIVRLLKIREKETRACVVEFCRKSCNAEMRIKESRSNLSWCRRKTAEMHKELNEMRKNCIAIDAQTKQLIEVRATKDAVLREISEHSWKLAEKYQIEARHNDVLPSLLAMAGEMEHAGQLLDQFDEKLDRLARQDSEEVDEVCLKASMLRREWQDLLVKIAEAQLERKQLRGMKTKDEEVEPTPVKRKEKRSPMDVKIASANSAIELVRRDIVVEQERHKILFNCTTALRSQLNRITSEISNLTKKLNAPKRRRKPDRTLANIELRIATKRDVITDRKTLFSGDCSNFIENLRGIQYRQFIDTHAIACDPRCGILMSRYCS